MVFMRECTTYSKIMQKGHSVKKMIYLPLATEACTAFASKKCVFYIKIRRAFLKRRLKIPTCLKAGLIIVAFLCTKLL